MTRPTNVTFGTRRVLCSMNEEDYKKLRKLADENYRSLSFQAGHMLHDLLAETLDIEDNWDEILVRFDEAVRVFGETQGTGMATHYSKSLYDRYNAGDRSNDLYKRMQDFKVRG